MVRGLAMSTVTLIDLTAMADADITNAELYRLYLSMKEDMRANFRALDDRLTVGVVSKDVYEARHMALTERVTVLEAAEGARENRRFALIAAITGSFVGDLVAIAVAYFHK